MKAIYKLLPVGLACAGLLAHDTATADELKFVCYEYLLLAKSSQNTLQPE